MFINVPLIRLHQRSSRKKTHSGRMERGGGWGGAKQLLPERAKTEEPKRRRGCSAEEVKRFVKGRTGRQLGKHGPSWQEFTVLPRNIPTCHLVGCETTLNSSPGLLQQKPRREHNTKKDNKSEEAYQAHPG